MRRPRLVFLSFLQVKYNEFAGGQQQNVIPTVNVRGLGKGGVIGFSAPLNSYAMNCASSAKEMGGPATSFQHVGTARAMSYAELEPCDGGNQSIVVRTSRT